MSQSSCWARVRARTSAPLRRGAWYRVVELGDLHVVLDVNGRLLIFGRGLVQVLPIRPPIWSVVLRPPNNSLAPGDRYGVCPNCSDRARLDGSARVMRCRQCRSVFAIAWSDAPWRALEVTKGVPDEATLARARTAALRELARAFRLPEE